MTTPDDFPRHHPSRQPRVRLLRPDAGIAVVAVFVVGALVVLGVMAVLVWVVLS